jgi:signal transduction histidine kinase/GAF domain-containing protein/CheY-like chemotaxis protein
MAAIIQDEEDARLEALRQYHILDTAPEESFDGLTLLAAYICEMPISLISLLDKDRQWFKSKIGLTISGTSRAVAFCNYTVSGKDLLIIPDTHIDNRVGTNPLVTGPPFIRFYAGVPLISPKGYAVGTLNVIDVVPRELTSEQIAALRTIARQIVSLFELRIDTIQLDLLNKRLSIEIEERQRIEGKLRQINQRLKAQNKTIAELSTRISYQEINLIYKEITKEVAQTLDVERVSIWEYSSDQTKLICADLYEHSSDNHSSGNELIVADYPNYFKAIQQEQAIVSHNAQTDSRTEEFTKEYLIPLGITSVLNAYIHIGGTPIGIICHEHVGTIRQWEADEENFAKSVADLIALSIEAYKHIQTERALRDSEIRLFQFLEVVPIGVLVIDTNGQPYYTNQHAKAIVRNELKPIPSIYEYPLYYELYIAGTDQKYPVEKMPWVKALNGEVSSVQDIELHQNEEVIPLEVTAAPIFDSSGKVVYAIAALRDITEQKEAEKEREKLLAREQLARREAEDANRLKDEFLATLSHELRTPLTSILGWSRLIQTAEMSLTQKGQGLETIERNARLQLQMINDLLDISKIILGKSELDIYEIDVASVIKSAIESIQLTAEAKGIRICTHTDQSIKPIPGDQARLQQIVLNLLSNAVKFTEHGGEIDVELKEKGEYVEIRVRDTGKGMSPEIVPYIFDRFRQEDSSYTRRYAGLGLGLAIARHWVKMHGGKIRAESEGEGQGATFIVELPHLVQSKYQKKIESEEKEAIIKGDVLKRLLEGVYVLVVEDDIDTLTLLRTILENSGAEVSLATSVASALDSYQKRRPNVVVSDIGLPGEDGIQLIQKIQELEINKEKTVPAIALTAYAGPKHKERVLKAGYKRYIVKPIEPSTLVGLVLDLTSRKRSASQ